MSNKQTRHRHRLVRRTQPGAAPGTIVVDPDAPKPVITVLAYGPEKFEERSIADVNGIKEFLGKWPVTWINVDGLGDATIIRQLGELLHLHPLALEDVVNVHQRAKVETYPEHVFVVMRMAHPGEQLRTEQVSMFLGKDFVVTFQESLPGDSFDPVRERIRGQRAAIRQRGCDYLCYALIDSAIDSFFPVLESLGERIEDLEEEALSDATRNTINCIHDVKHDLLMLRRAIWPAREALHSMARDPCPMVTDETRIYLRDAYDHTIQLLDLLETYRELGSDLRDLYLSSVSTRMNEIMKVLTIISTIFIPLTFIVGLYGMNFEFMPELHWRYGYASVWVVMAVVVIFMTLFFWRKGWIGDRAPVMDTKEDRDENEPQES